MERLEIIPLTGGFEAIVDAADYNWLMQWKWRIVPKGYAQRSVAKNEGFKLNALFMHRQILNTPSDMFSDHINGNKLDNRRCNLRICTPHQNNLNRPNITGKYKGVYWCKRLEKWMAQIMIGEANKYVGSFPNQEEAALAYNEAAIKYHGEFARLNKLPDDYVPSAKQRYSSKYWGVCYQKKIGRWWAKICHKGVITSLGTYVTEIEAAEAYNAASIGFGRARLNVIYYDQKE